MAQIAIPVLLVGVAYLMSNDKDEKKFEEGFTELYDDTNTHNDGCKDDMREFKPSKSKTSINTNNQETLTQYQDKYYIHNAYNKQNEEEFQTLAGNIIKSSDLNHNNTQMFYSGKTQGYNHDNTTVLDNYTGRGTFDIKKDETATFFKPESNLQNVYGNQNQNDFLQSRVNASHRHANTKPWQEIKDTPGIGMDYHEINQEGMSNLAKNRDMYTPKNVDELRAKNNPKMVYSLENHVGPAINPIKNSGIQGKIVKQLPDTTFVNNSQLGMIAQTTGPGQPMQLPEQMMTAENRSSTSIEYYGARGSTLDNTSYVSGQFMEPHKQQLCSETPINMSIQGTHPTNTMNYSKDSYSVFENNRSTTDDSYFGGIGRLISNVTEPVVKGLRHTKKTNVVTNSNPSGNLNGGYKQPIVYNPNENTMPTNREMYEKDVPLKHLNVQNQDATAYMSTRPLLNDTQRSSMNQNQSGPAQSSHQANKNYDAEYNQRNKTKITASNVHSHGNIGLFNNKIKMLNTDKELCNDRQTPFYNPVMANYEHPSERLGEFTSMPQSYENRNPEKTDSSLLKAFKQNPYTQSLSSV